MSTKTSFFILYKPAVPKRYLLMTAAIVWTLAGSMLLFRGFSILLISPQLRWLKIILSLCSGILFFVFLFSKISLKHTQRIIDMPIERPCVFSFFNLRSYIMMTVMIGMGITLRKTGLVPLQYLSCFYVAMGTPLLLSAFRFYYNSILYKKVVKPII